FLELDGVELVFEDAALRAIARKAMERKTGARGLRAILEETLIDVMYDIPSRTDVKRCVITAGVIEGREEPHLYPEIRKAKEEPACPPHWAWVSWPTLAALEAPASRAAFLWMRRPTLGTD